MLTTLVIGALVQSAVPHVARVEVTPDSITLEVDQSAALSVQAWDSAGAGSKPRRSRFFSPNTDIVAVDSTGLLSALRPGRVVVLVGRSGVFARVAVAVPQLPPATIELAIPGGDVVPVGAGAPLVGVAVTRLGDAIPAPMTWGTSDAAIASVDQAGRLWAVGEGRCDGVGIFRRRDREHDGNGRPQPGDRVSPGVESAGPFDRRRGAVPCRGRCG